MKPELSEPVKVALQEVLNKIEQVEESDADFLDRMKQVICENKDMDSADLDRLLALKGKNNALATELVELWEKSPENALEASGEAQA